MQHMSFTRPSGAEVLVDAEAIVSAASHEQDESITILYLRGGNTEQVKLGLNALYQKLYPRSRTAVSWRIARYLAAVHMASGVTRSDRDWVYDNVLRELDCLDEAATSHAQVGNSGDVLDSMTDVPE